MRIADFLPLNTIRAPHIAWLLGAGASAAAGIPTAYNMIWDFKRSLYCAAHRVSIRTVEDLGDPALRQRLQRFFDSESGHPHQDADEEYAHYFEAVYPAEADRRRYLEKQLAGATPSIGHRALAALVASGKIRLIWMTNFDRLVEDAIIAALGSSGNVTVATLDNSRVAGEALNEGRWPLVGKLHGDFKSRMLKNTTVELLAQDAELRHALVESCKRFGLAVVGYSGRDRSVMDSLEEAVADGRGYPHGLFWFHRTGTPLQPRVQQLIDKATRAGVEAHLVESETFDELMTDLTLLCNDLPQQLIESIDLRRLRISDAPIPRPGRGWPVIRTNALPVISMPEVCRRIECEIGGTREVLDAIAAAGTNVLAGRTRGGVLAFGSDPDVRATFNSYGISEFDLHPMERRRLHYESTEMGLLYQALMKAIARERPLVAERRGRSYFLRPHLDPGTFSSFSQLSQATRGLTGNLTQSRLGWSEALRVRLDYRLSTLWLLIEPTVLVERPELPDQDAKAEATEFVRARLAGRYNAAWNALLDAWSTILIGPAQVTTLRSFGLTNGVDATFQIARTTGFIRP